MSRVPAPREVVEWGWAGRALEGPSGDGHVVAGFPGGTVVALLDGLGHGPEAAAAVAAAVPVLRKRAGEPVLELLHACHEAMRATRGAVMTLASLRVADSSMSWVGVGNVEGVLLRAHDSAGGSREAIAARSGVVGFRLPELRETTMHVARGDTLILATDGIRGGFTEGLALGAPPQEIAESIVARFTKGTDDAHVVVARYLGGAA